MSFIKGITNKFRQKPGERKRKLIEKMRDSHSRVLDAYQAFDINVGHVPLIGINPLLAAKLGVSEYYLLFGEIGEITYCPGAYDATHDVILYNQLLCERMPSHMLDAVLVHEYAHRLMSIYLSAFSQHNSMRQHPERALNPLQLPQGGHSEPARSPESVIKEIENSLEVRLRKSRTRDELLKEQFEIYFKEMWAKSLELYLTEQPDDRKWMFYSGAKVGFLLIEDYDFFKKIQSTIHTLFFERLFSHGLNKTARRLPLFYAALKFKFDQHYEKSLPENVVIPL